MFKRLRDFLALSMGISTPGAEPNELKWLNQDRKDAEKGASPVADEPRDSAGRRTPDSGSKPISPR